LAFCTGREGILFYLTVFTYDGMILFVLGSLSWLYVLALGNIWSLGTEQSGMGYQGSEALTR
jgi:hypothetical protein